MKEITVFNNLTKKKEILEPKNPPIINIYTCGPTVYDHSHIGHARSAISWDFIVRFLIFAGYKAIWTRNITDIDDKIINKSKEILLTPDKVARIYTFSFHEDMNTLGIEWPNHEPKATEYLKEMFDFIKNLLNKGNAYQIENDIYFSISSFKDYGKLKGQPISELEKGYGRIEPNLKKKHQLDFALWKGIKDKEDFGYESPWGKGRPGWHLECSAMNHSIYGANLDIHGGGDDLIFPHHENEIAQSEALTGKQFAKYWLHNGMIMVNGKKMAKSEGNFITIKDALKKTTGSAIRFFVLNTQYRMPLNFTEEAIGAAQNGIYRLKEAMSDFILTTNTNTKSKINNEYIEEFSEVMSDDFNSPKALSVLFKVTDKINTERNAEKRLILQETLYLLARVLGFDLSENNIDSTRREMSLSTVINSLINWRNSCKEQKDFTTADRIREVLNKSNIEVKDLPNNQYKWKVKI